MYSSVDSDSNVQGSDSWSTWGGNDSEGVDSKVERVSSVPRSQLQKTHSRSTVRFAPPEEPAPDADLLIDGASHHIPVHDTGAKTQKEGLLTPFPRCPGPSALGRGELMSRPSCTAQLGEKYPELADIYSEVTATGLPNYTGARRPVPHDLDIKAWRSYEHLLRDSSLVDMLEFGFPVGFTGSEPPTAGLDNHSSARLNPAHVSNYIDTELEHKAIVGPFNNPPFTPWFRLNPAMTRPKRDSPDFRVILDLSFP